MDRENKVSNFYELGMTDPFKTKKSIEDAISEVKTFDFFTQVYPLAVMRGIVEAFKNEEIGQAPKCIFVPEKALLRQMMKALLKYGVKDS
jgi:hypothetical protein